MRFRATYHPVNYIEQKVHAIFPALERIVTVYRKERELSVSADGNLLILNETDNVLIQKWRSRAVTYSWMRPEDFPWIESRSTKDQLQMSDEHENRMLLLCFVSPEDKMKDLVALCFPKNTKFFGLQKELQEFTTDEKVIVGEMLHKLLGYEYQQAIGERESLLAMQRFQQLKHKEQSASVRNDTAFEKYFFQVCQSMLREAIQDNTITCSITQEGLHYLAASCTDLDELKIILAKSVELAFMLEPYAQEHLLEKMHFESVMESPGLVHHTADQDQKAADLLNRYEEAAARASRQGLAISGKIVAQFLDPAISPPAVSESLKKHATRIEKLLKENPGEWKLIRNALKPIRELDTLNVFRMAKPA